MIRRNFIRVCNDWLDKINLQGHKYIIYKKVLPAIPWNINILNYKRNPSATSRYNYGKQDEEMEIYPFLNNQFCTNTLNNVTVLPKSVHAVRQFIDKGSFSKMTIFQWRMNISISSNSVLLN